MFTSTLGEIQNGTIDSYAVVFGVTDARVRHLDITVPFEFVAHCVLALHSSNCRTNIPSFTCALSNATDRIVFVTTPHENMEGALASILNIFRVFTADVWMLMALYAASFYVISLYAMPRLLLLTKAVC